MEEFEISSGDDSFYDKTYQPPKNRESETDSDGEVSCSSSTKRRLSSSTSDHGMAPTIVKTKPSPVPSSTTLTFCDCGQKTNKAIPCGPSKTLAITVSFWALDSW